jgi:hypothetical protein
VKELVGDFSGCLGSDSLRSIFKFTSSCFKLPDSLFSFFLSSHDSLNSDCPSFLEQKNIHLNHYNKFSAELTNKSKKFKKDAKDSSHSLKILIWKMLEKMVKLCYQMLSKVDCRTTSNMIKFLNICSGFFPFTEIQAEAFMSLLEIKLKDKNETPEERECHKLCQSFNFFLMKKLDEKEFIDSQKLESILGNISTKKERKKETKQTKETQKLVNDQNFNEEYETKRERKKKGKRKNREKRPHRRREKSPFHSPLNKRSNLDFKSNSDKSRDHKNNSDKQNKKEKLQSKLRKLREGSKVKQV